MTTERINFCDIICRYWQKTLYLHKDLNKNLPTKGVAWWILENIPAVLLVEKHGISEHTALNHCIEDRIEETFLTGKTWKIPTYTELSQKQGLLSQLQIGDKTNCYLIGTNLTAQDNFKLSLDFFKIKYWSTNERTKHIISRLATTHSVHPARHGGSDCAASLGVVTQGGFGIEIPEASPRDWTSFQHRHQSLCRCGYGRTHRIDCRHLLCAYRWHIFHTDMVGTVSGILTASVCSSCTSDTIQGICPRHRDIPHLHAICDIWAMEYMAHHNNRGVLSHDIVRNIFYYSQSQVCSLVRNEDLTWLIGIAHDKWHGHCRVKPLYPQQPFAFGCKSQYNHSCNTPIIGRYSEHDIGRKNASTRHQEDHR